MRRYSDAETEIFAARVHIREASRRRRQSAFHATLLEWAANCRRRYVAAKAEEARRVRVAQLDLFGSQ